MSLDDTRIANVLIGLPEVGVIDALDSGEFP